MSHFFSELCFHLLLISVHAHRSRSMRTGIINPQPMSGWYIQNKYIEIQCVFSSHVDISTIGMAQDLFGLLTKLNILIMYIVKYFWFFKLYIVHLLITICIYIYILYYILTHIFMYSETSCSSSSNNSYFNSCFTDAARQKVIRHFLYSIYIWLYT